jgi:large conductance mechanosensitive channel
MSFLNGFLKEFRDFAVKGNAIDMAVGVVMGVAFGNLVNSLVKDIMMPPLDLLMRQVTLSGLSIPLGAGAPISYGLFINTLINFLIVAFAVFLMIRQINWLKAAPPPADPTSKDCPACCTAIPIKATRCPHCTSQLAAG